MKLNSSLYHGTVFHRRMRPVHHQLRYKVFTLLIDIDELPDLDRQLKWFSYNKWSLVAFYDKDHGPLIDLPLREWVEVQLQEAGIFLEGGPIRLLCYPRIFGYVFNPLSVFFCYNKNGKLIAILYEVCNTFNERHTYIIPVKDNEDKAIHQTCKKSLYVSPFIGMEADYDFRINPPGRKIKIKINQKDQEGIMLTAVFTGLRTNLTNRSLIQAFFSVPILTLKIILGIHWEAAVLWLKGCPMFKHRPAPNPVQSSVGHCATKDIEEIK